MSRAFVRESDDQPDLPLARQSSALPPGAKNYITAEGAERLRRELQRLTESERPALVSQTDDPDAKRQLFALDQRIHQIEHSLQSAEIVPPPSVAVDVVRFGATVTVRDQRGEESVYRIVGVDEAHFEADSVSWISPIARALTGAKIGEHVQLRMPSGADELEVIGIAYE